MALNQGDTLAKLVSVPKSEMESGETAEPARLRINGQLVSYTVVETSGNQDGPDGFTITLKKGASNQDTEPTKEEAEADEKKKADADAKKAKKDAEKKAEPEKRETSQGTTSKNLFAK